MTDAPSSSNAAGAASSTAPGASAPSAAALPPAAGGAPSVPTDPSAALAMRDGLMHDRGFAIRFNSHDPAISGEARALMAELNRAAHPDPAAGPAPKEGTPEHARAEIERLRGDHSFIKRYSEGDYQARQQLDALHEQAYGDPATAAQPAADALPIVFGEHVPEAERAQMHATANEAIETLGVDRAEAAAAIDMIERAHVARRGPDGTPREMDDAEFLQFERGLKAAWGDQYDAKTDRVEAALKRAGPGGEWLRKSLLHAGPAAVIGVFQYLADIEQGAPRG